MKQRFLDDLQTVVAAEGPRFCNQSAAPQTGPGGLVESRPELDMELVMATRGCS